MAKTLRSDAHAHLLSLLKRTRDEAGLTQAVVAERLGKPQSYVAKTEGGERRLDVVEFVALARALGAEPAALIAALDRAMPAAEPSKGGNAKGELAGP